MLEARVYFGAVHQKNYQSVGEFAAELRAASVDCQFGLGLDGRLRDQFAFGLMPGSIRNLLDQEDLQITFSKAVKKASELEKFILEAEGRSVSSNTQVESSRSRSGPVFGSDQFDKENKATGPKQSGPHSVVQCSESSTSSVASLSVLRSEIELQLASRVGNPVSCNEYGAATEATRSTEIVKQSAFCFATKSQLELLVEGGREEAFTVGQEVCAENLAQTSVETSRSHLDSTHHSDSSQVITTSALRTPISVNSTTSVKHKTAVRSTSSAAATRSARLPFRSGPQSGPDLLNGLQGRRNGSFNRISHSASRYHRQHHRTRKKLSVWTQGEYRRLFKRSGVRLHCNHRKRLGPRICEISAARYSASQVPVALALLPHIKFKPGEKVWTSQGPDLYKCGSCFTLSLFAPLGNRVIRLGGDRRARRRIGQLLCNHRKRHLQIG